MSDGMRELVRGPGAVTPLVTDPTAPGAEGAGDDRAAPLGVRTRMSRFLRHPSLVVGAVLAIVVVVLVLAAPLITSTSPTAQDVLARFQGPSRAHLFGTDQFGRDIFTRVLYGGRVTLLGSVEVVVLGGTIGTALGLLAGFAGGWVNFAVMRLVDLMLAFPGILLALSVNAILGPGFTHGVLAVALVLIPIYARVIESATAAVRRMPYIDSAVTLGATRRHVVVRHILPNVASSILVLSTSWLGVAVLWLSSLGFIGLGAQPPSPEWGSLLADGKTYITLAWWLTTFPGVFLAVFIIATNLLGDGLRDELDTTLARD
jgi:ABC-type dipeptide/oligopeptide/nickel transport system permease subunit